ncbi:MAG: radical SAM protein, partial [Deltaproteobacteria bacterium]|nr:radical SAM protein [Deltaproteobacteria bacterium]
MSTPRRAASVGLRDFPKLVAVHRAALPRKRLFAHPDLTYLFWESTLRCNLKCRHCGSSCTGRSPFKELETSQILGILDTIAEDFDASRIFVSITGGEPLLRPDLLEVVKRLTRHRMRSCIVTNGTLLGAKEAGKLAEAGMRTASISIDGMEGSHEAVRGKGTWRPTLAAFTHARKAGFRTIEALTCVRPGNLAELEQIEAAVREAGATRWRLLTIWKMGRLAGAEAPEMRLTPAGVRTLLDFVARRREQLRLSRKRFPIRFSCGGFLGARRELAVRPRDGQCFAGLCIASILCDGMVSACPSLPRSWAQGSALEARFSSLWRDGFQKFRETEWRRTDKCKDCSWFSICLGGGLHE